MQWAKLSFYVDCGTDEVNSGITAHKRRGGGALTREEKL